MKACDMTNLFVGYNKTEDFRILICALDKEEAAELARCYGFDASLEGSWEISEFSDMDTKFDADYVITGGQ